jgi:hypothetical protein
MYGGDINDHVRPNPLHTDYKVSLESSGDLGGIYSQQVQPTGSLKASSTVIGFNPASLIDRGTPDPLSIQLSNTLAKIANEYGLLDDGLSTINTNFTPVIKDHGTAEIQQANDAVTRALEELKSLGEI